MVSVVYSLISSGATNNYTFTCTGTAGAGETYIIRAYISGGPSSVIGTFSPAAGDSESVVALGLYNSINPAYRNFISAGVFNISIPGIMAGVQVLSTTLPPPQTVGYGLYLTSTFQNVSGGTSPFGSYYIVEIEKKNYSGPVKSATTTYTKLRCDTDDPIAPIKGQSFEFNLLNEGTLPLESFLSVEDDEYRVRFVYSKVSGLNVRTRNELFVGFLVQDDCSEEMIDVRHEIKLSANDNLGIIKDVAFDKAPGSYSVVFTASAEVSSVAPHQIGVEMPFGGNLLVGDKLAVTGTAIDGEYTVENILLTPSIAVLTVTEVVATMTVVTGTLGIKRFTYGKKSLLNIIRTCLSATGLPLVLNVFSNIKETTQNSLKSFLEQTLVEAETFMKNGIDFEDCYSVLTKILTPEKLCLHQSKGAWVLVRWYELKYYANAIPGFVYDKDSVLTGTSTLNDGFTAGLNQTTFPETGLIKRIFRPYKYFKETFNYKQPAQLLKNFDLQQVGILLRQYTSGTAGVDLHKISEYAMPWWEYSNTFPTSSGSLGAAEYFIRVVKDEFNNELERDAVVKRNGIRSYKIEANKGDRIKFSFQFKMSQTYAGPSNVVFYVQLTDGTLTKYIKGASDVTKNTWDNTVGYVYKIASGDNANQWHSVQIDSDVIPFDGLLRVYLREIIAVPNETSYKDIRFEYISYINQSVKIIGHTHTYTLPPNIKQNLEEEIYIDNSPKNSIAGTLFLDTLTGVLQTKANRWKRGHLTENKNLGEIITTETEQWRQTFRKILEGTLYGIITGNTHVSLSSVFTYTAFPGKYFVFGKMEIDHHNNNVRGTLWEMYDSADLDVSGKYDFKYLYQ